MKTRDAASIAQAADEVKQWLMTHSDGDFVETITAFTRAVSGAEEQAFAAVSQRLASDAK